MQASDYNANTELLNAARRGENGSVKQALTQGAHVDVVDENGSTALDLAKILDSEKCHHK